MWSIGLPDGFVVWDGYDGIFTDVTSDVVERIFPIVRQAVLREDCVYDCKGVGKPHTAYKETGHGGL
jgi:hypothetical protein